MTDFKIGPPGGAGPSQAQGPEKAASTDAGKDFELHPESTTTETTPSTSAIEPSKLVEQLRSGQVTLEQAVEVLVEQALNSQPLEGVSETLRQHIRQALIDLVQDDPTLASLASAMKR